MKILVVSNTFDPVTGGGEAERSYQLANALTKAGADCRVLTIDTGLTSERKQVVPQGKMTALPCLFRRFYVPKTGLKQICKIVAMVDVIHLIGHWSIINVLVYLAARFEKKPYVICPAGSLLVFGRSKFLKQFYNFIVGTRIVRNAALVIAITQDEIAQVKAYGVSQEKIQVIPNGIAATDFASADVISFRKKHNLETRPFILFLGRLNPIKGPDLFLEAFISARNILPAHDLIFVGPDGGLLSELKALAKQNEIASRVHFIGYLGGNEKSDALHAADFLVVPSRHEAMSIVALEAGICGTPVLLTDQCGFNELAEIGGGWVVPASAEALARGITEIISKPEARKTASLNIKNYVTKNFSWDYVISHYFAIFEKIKTVS